MEKRARFVNVPNTKWKALEPYWPDIIASIIEVLHEESFNLSEVRKTNPTGFIAPAPYWDLNQYRPRKYSLKQAKKFIYLLKEKPRFVESITGFNQGHNTDWLSEEKISTLGGFLCSLCSPILDYLRTPT